MSLGLIRVNTREPCLTPSRSALREELPAFLRLLINLLSISQAAKMTDSIKYPNESITPRDQASEAWLIPQPSSDPEDPLASHPCVSSLTQSTNWY